MTRGGAELPPNHEGLGIFQAQNPQIATQLRKQSLASWCFSRAPRPPAGDTVRQNGVPTA